MRELIRAVCLSVVAGLMLVPVRSIRAQEIAAVSYDRGPRFLLATATKVVPVDVSKTPVLARRLFLELEGATLKEALGEIAVQSGLVLVYSDEDVPLGNHVHLRAEAITVAAALTDVLFDAGLDVVFKADGNAALVKRPPLAQNGSVTGLVTDSKTSAAIAGATVAIERTSLSTTTDNDGRYRITEVAPGTYTVRARYIGYAPTSASVTVTAEQEATADFALEKSAQRLDEVVTTGTVVPTQVKALPTPVTVIGASDIDAQRPRTVAELFRRAIPGAVSWDVSNTPQGTSFSVRGASTLVGGGQMKVFVDGVEVANPTMAPVDPNSIERIEVLRGPQAAAIYGSDAIGGVVHIFMKRGDPSLSRPQVSGDASMGILQTPYAGFDDVLRQDYRATVSGGGPGATYNFGGGYSHLANWAPNDELSAQSNPSVFGGVHVSRGIFTANVSGRYYKTNTNAVFNPALAGTGFFLWTKPNFAPFQTQNATIGAELSVEPTRWWRHAVNVGFDRLATDLAQTRPRLTSPADTLLFVLGGSNTKTSIGSYSTVHGPLGGGVSGSLTAGFDHWSLPAASFIAFGTLNTTGTIRMAPNGFMAISRTMTTNTGYYLQTQVGLREALFLTGGFRLEDNSDFGDSLGTPVSPRVGLSYLQSVAGATLKVRSSWGRAIRAPLPGLRLAGVFGTGVVLPNSTLGPERQEGWDAGVEAFFGSRGWLSLTYYHQTAKDLIQLVALATDSVLTYQYQNVGRVKNTGVELEGMIGTGALTLKAQYGYSRSRVAQLAPGYTGVLQIDDQTLDTPKHTAGATLTVSPGQRTGISAGLTYVGSWRDFDNLAYYGCIGGTAPCRNSTFALDRNYLMDYSGYVRVNASVTQQITPFISGFVSIDNVTNNHHYEVSDLNAVWGRISTVGLHFQY